MNHGYSWILTGEIDIYVVSPEILRHKPTWLKIKLVNRAAEESGGVNWTLQIWILSSTNKHACQKQLD
jgi:hypothetical protein